MKLLENSISATKEEHIDMITWKFYSGWTIHDVEDDLN